MTIEMTHATSRRLQDQFLTSKTVSLYSVVEDEDSLSRSISMQRFTLDDVISRNPSSLEGKDLMYVVALAGDNRNFETMKQVLAKYEGLLSTLFVSHGDSLIAEYAHTNYTVPLNDQMFMDTYSNVVQQRGDATDKLEWLLSKISPESSYSSDVVVQSKVKNGGDVEEAVALVPIQYHRDIKRRAYKTSLKYGNKLSLQKTADEASSLRKEDLIAALENGQEIYDSASEKASDEVKEDAMVLLTRKGLDSYEKGKKAYNPSNLQRMLMAAIETRDIALIDKLCLDYDSTVGEDTKVKKCSDFAEYATMYGKLVGKEEEYEVISKHLSSK